MDTNGDWYSSSRPAKIKRRGAADKFLNAVLDDSNHLGVVGFDKHREAKKAFETLGKIKLPQNVRVICLEADTTAMSDLVVFALYPKLPGKQQSGLWRQRWVAAWEPY